MSKPSLAAAAYTAAQELWRQLDAALHADTGGSGGAAPLLSALGALHASRQRLGSISDAQAASIAATLPCLLAGGAEATAQGWPAALELLSRWAQAARVSTSSSGTPQQQQQQQQQQQGEAGLLSDATSTVLSALRGHLPAAAVGPAIGFLGSAATAGERCFSPCASSMHATAAVCDHTLDLQFNRSQNTSLHL
jgi:hypothetical protein